MTSTGGAADECGETLPIEPEEAQFEYYPNGRMFRHTPIGADAQLRPAEATTFTWNEFRREAKQVNGRGFERAFYFDAYGNATKTIEEDGAVRQYTYFTGDPAKVNLRASETNPQGQVSRPSVRCTFSSSGAPNISRF